MKSLNIAMIAACPFPAAFASSGLIRELSLAMEKRGHSVHVVTYHLGLDTFDTTGLHVHRIPNVPLYRKFCSGISPGKPVLDMLLARRLMSLLKKTPIDLIHAHNYEAPPVGYISRFFHGTPVIYHAHNTMLHELPTYFKYRPVKLAAGIAGNYLDRWIPRRADHVIALSDAQKDYLCQKGVSEDRITVIPPCIYPESFQGGDRDEMRRNLGLGNDPVIIYTGGLQPYQNCAALIPLLRDITPVLPDIHLIIVARSAPDWLRSLAEQCGVADRIHFLAGSGLRWERACLAAADVAVIPREHCIGFPIKLLNYFAARKPVVCYNGLVTGFRPGEEYVGVPAGDVHAMADAVIQLLTDPSRAQRIADAGYAAVWARHHWNVASADIETIYRGVLSGTGRQKNNPSLSRVLPPVFKDFSEGEMDI